LTALFILAFLALPVGGGWFFSAQERHVRADVEANLAAIAQLKVDQIVWWRAEHLNDAAMLMESPFIGEAISRWMADPRVESAGPILTQFRSLLNRFHYSDVLLVDPGGRVRLSLSGLTDTVHDDTAQSLSAALRGRQPVLTNLHTGPGGLPPHVETIAPLFGGNGEGSEPIGAILLRSDAGQFLYPMIQSWPTPSRSAETLLVRREGDTVLFLNELRHQPDTALKLRIPLSSREVPAVMGVLGKEGAVEGKDYRGVDVLSVLKPVPSSPWFMVAKIDKTEALEDWRFKSFLILALILGSMAAAAAAAAMVRQLYAKAHFRALFLAEAAHRDSEERYRTTLMSVGDAVIITNAEGRVRLLNPVAELLTGWSQEEAREKPIDEVFRIVNEETRQPAVAPVARVLREGVILGLANHTLLVSRDSREIPIADSAAPITDEAGQVNGVVLVFRDQTSERQAEMSLKALFSRQQALLAAVPDIIMEVDAQRIYTWANQAGLDFFGEDVIGKEASYYFEGEQDTYGMVQPLFEGDEDVIYVESWQRRRDGRKRLLAWCCRVLKDESGKVSGAISSASDITERMRMEQERLRSEESYRLLVRNIPGVVYRGYADGSVEFFDNKIEAVTGYPGEDFTSRRMKWTDLIHPDDLASSKALFLAALRGEREYVREYRVKRMDGDYAWVQERSQIVCRDDGRVDYVSGVLFDVTDRKREEEEKENLEAQFRQAQKMEAVGRLAGGVAHDFNNMLGVILGYTELALIGLNPIDPLHAHLNAVQAAAERSADLTRQLLAFSRKQTIAPRTVDFNQQTRAMERLLTRIIGEDIDLVFELSPELWPVYMDPAQIDQVVANLAVNSRDAMPGGGKLTVETANITLDPEYCETHLGFVPADFVMLAVSDTGCGMDKETLDHAFEPFFTTKSEGKGTGLGLATVYGIVKQNNGFVNVYSEPGQGTTFKVYIPRYAGTEAAAPVAEEKGLPAGGWETILLVEDESQMRQLAKVILERLGYRVLEASDPRDAIALCKEFPGEIHLLLTDVVMPNMNGRELEGRIKEIKPTVTTLFMSGYTANAIAHRGVIEKGANFLQKPFSVDAMAKKVREALGSKS
jgi:two-component system, cell cycle sensor histidine kinase and response regulator CckA